MEKHARLEDWLKQAISISYSLSVRYQGLQVQVGERNVSEKLTHHSRLIFWGRLAAPRDLVGQVLEGSELLPKAFAASLGNANLTIWIVEEKPHGEEDQSHRNPTLDAAASE